MKITIRTRQLSDGTSSIYLDYYDKGERRIESLGLYLQPETNKHAKTLNDDAMRRATEIRAERLLASTTPKKKQVAKEQDKVIMKEWMEGYLNLLSLRLKPQSLEHHRTLVNVVNAFLKSKRKTNLPIADFNKDMVKEFIDYVRNVYRVQKFTKEQELSEFGVYNKQQHLCQLFNEAVKDGVIKANPLHLMSANEKVQMPEADRSYLTVEEVKRLEETPVNAEHDKAGFLFCCYTGLRLSDLRSLTWSEICYTATGMEIRKRMKKTGAIVNVPLSKQALRWLPERNGAAETDKVFYMLPHPQSCHSFAKRFARLAGINKKVCFHTSRHTFGTLSLCASDDLYTVKNLMGHRSILSTQVYAKVLDTKKQEAVDMLNNLF